MVLLTCKDIINDSVLCCRQWFRIINMFSAAPLHKIVHRSLKWPTPKQWAVDVYIAEDYDDKDNNLRNTASCTCDTHETVISLSYYAKRVL